MDEYIVLDLISATEAAAVACYDWIGKNDRKAADNAAVEAMRKAFNDIHIKGKVVIGEGERDKAPMLYIGEEVGSGKGPGVDIAVDPLEGTNLCARNDPGAIAVLAAGPAGGLLHAPDTYMDKIAVGPKAKGMIDLDASVEENIRAVAKALGKPVEEIIVLIMDRDRNEKYLTGARKLGCKVKLIRDGDIAGAILPALGGEVDILLGIGAAPEGVIAAAALQCLDGDFQGRLWFHEEAQRKRAVEEMGVKYPDKKLLMKDLVHGDTAFVASGVTTGDILKGVRKENGKTTTHTLVMHKGEVRYVETTR